MYRSDECNFVRLAGRLAGEAVPDHKLGDEVFYSAVLEVERLSGAADLVPLTLPGRLIAALPEPGSMLHAEGQLRSYNRQTPAGSRLILTVFVRELQMLDPAAPCENEVRLSGYLCKPASFRTTPFQREISDLLIAVNRAFGKSDYLPCIAWGRNAHLAREIPVGSRVEIVGRIQSREYQKKLMDGVSETRTAYEVSCTRVLPV